ncbi:MAG: hypothetical protein RLZZ147_529 [Actinomycetota bacterium]
MKRAPIFLALAVATSIFTPIQNAAASKTTVSLAVQSTPNAGESLVTFYGQVKPATKALVHLMVLLGRLRLLKLHQVVVALGA